MDSKIIIQKRLDELPQTITDFISNEKWRISIADISQEFNLSQEQVASLENQVFTTLLCLNYPSDLVENLQTELMVNSNVAESLAESVDEEILEPIAYDIEAVWQKESSSETQEKVPQIKDSVGDSFEQAIINQARAMRPARLASESVAGGPVGEGATAPDNLPTGENSSQNTEQRKIHDYPTNNDPYREATQ